MNGKVIAWHTPDEKYTSLADRLKRQLQNVGQDFIFYTIDKEADESWTEVITRTKTSLWRRAIRDTLPGTPLLFLDVDCNINGPLTTLFDKMENADIGVSIFHKPGGSFYFSTRALFMNSTHEAIDFMALWQKVSTGARNEEGTLKTLIGSHDFDARIRKIPERFAAKELKWAPKDAVITHTSAHKDDLPAIKRIEHGLRGVYRSFVPGRKVVSA